MPEAHQHDYTEQGDYLVCSICGKKILHLRQTDKKGLLEGTKGDKRNYSVRQDRRRYFFPDEWDIFMKQVEDKTHRFFFLTCLHTGGRIMEVLNLRHKDIDVERSSITFETVKQRKAKKNFYALGKSRGFFVASEFIKEYKSSTRNKKINNEDYIFLDNTKLPEDYDKLDNAERKQYFSSKSVAYSNLLKRKIKKTKIEDWYNFSPHNLRKTYGMWMRTFGVEMGELCYRMGHDMDTFMAHYGSSLIFTTEERRKIAKIMGDVK